MDRFARQRKLAAVGDLGQARLECATYRISSGAAGEVERDYLERAGAIEFAEREQEPVAFRHAAVFLDPSARAYAEGAWRALVQIKEALELP